MQGVAVCHRRHVRIRVAQGPQPGEPVRITGVGQVAYQAARAGCLGHQPAQRGAHEIGADRHQQRRGQRI